MVILTINNKNDKWVVLFFLLMGIGKMAGWVIDTVGYDTVDRT
jgi:hypothetical protein